MPRPATSSRAAGASVAGLLIRADLIHHLAGLDALRLRNRHPEEQRPTEIADHGVGGVIVSDVGGATLKPGMHVRGDQRRDDGLAGQIDAADGRRRGEFPWLPDRGDASLLDQDGGAFEDRGVVAGDQAGTLVQHLRLCHRRRHEQTQAQSQRCTRAHRAYIRQGFGIRNVALIIALPLNP